LLLATMVNYLDRQALTVTSARIMAEFELTNEEYGWLEMCFGLAFAAGQIILGMIADRTSVRWFYPFILACWSIMGFLTGMVYMFWALLVCRALLGFFEGGNWPCGITTVQRVLPPSKRSLGNGLLQGGGAIGAILTPLIMAACLTDAVGSWRPVFQAIGAIGLIWIVLWAITMRGRKMIPSYQLKEGEKTASGGDAASELFASVIFSRRFLVVWIVSICCNLCWHMVRVWMPLFLQKGRGFAERDMLAINAGYFAAADVGCWVAGGLTMWLAHRGLPLYVARRRVYLMCCLMTATSLFAFVDSDTAVIVILMLVGAGCLGMFPAFYSLSQELSHRHQGKTIGVLGASAWLVLAVLHPLFGRWVDQTGSYVTGIVLVGLIPMVSCVVLWLAWTAKDEAK
jgi:ACS family hexuronate transporter-like MFS transporter